MKRESTSFSLPRTTATPRDSARSATTSSPVMVEVATMTVSIWVAACAARITHSSTGRPPRSSRTFPGRRVEPARAWMTALIAMVLLLGGLDDVPAQGRAHLRISAERASLDHAEQVRRETARRPDGSDVCLGDHVAGDDIRDDEQGAAQAQTLGLGQGGTDTRPSERDPGGLSLAHQRRELVRLKGEGRVNPAASARDGHVLLDGTCAQSDSRDGRTDTHRVVGQTDQGLEGVR